MPHMAVKTTIGGGEDEEALAALIVQRLDVDGDGMLSLAEFSRHVLSS
eukprot:COSAG05_NODE_238_length_13155_cov_489.969899_11_plen_48_part_00